MQRFSKKMQKKLLVFTEEKATLRETLESLQCILLNK